MKTVLKSIMALGFALCLVSCENLLREESSGQICLSFEKDVYLQTKALSVIPDTNAFLLTVTSSKGNVIYSGTYGAAPETMLVTPGTYTIEVKSHEFKAPAFSDPQWGDSQVVVVKEGQASTVVLECTQLNAGVKLYIDSGFLVSYPKGVLYLKSDDGRLMYSYSEKRIAYFNPGSVCLQLSNDGETSTLLTRSLSARDVFHLNLTVAAKAATGEASSLSIQVDTSCNHISESYEIGSGSSSSGADKSDAIGVVEARKSVGKKAVWVYGYIVGGDLSSSDASFAKPFSSRTNLCIASKSSVKTKSSCLSVQLSKGDVRDALNLVDHPDNLGHMLYVKGDIVEAYFGIPGVQNITEYELN